MCPKQAALFQDKHKKSNENRYKMNQQNVAVYTTNSKMVSHHAILLVNFSRCAHVNHQQTVKTHNCCVAANNLPADGSKMSHQTKCNCVHNSKFGRVF